MENKRTWRKQCRKYCRKDDEKRYSPFDSLSGCGGSCCFVCDPVSGEFTARDCRNPSIYFGGYAADGSFYMPVQRLEKRDH